LISEIRNELETRLETLASFRMQSKIDKTTPDGYIPTMQTKPVPLRCEKKLLDLLRDGARRTPHKKQELIRITLRRYLPIVIEEEARTEKSKRITNIEPWSKEMLREAYKERDKEWEKIEDAATRAQGKPSFED